MRKQNEARIQKAISGFRIPMMSIPKLYKMLEQAVESDWADVELKQLVKQFPGVEEASS
jgi:hypothetical protein